MAYQDSDDELEEYVEDREPRSHQRLLIIILSVGCLALAVSNVVLAMRLTQLRRAERTVAAAPREQAPSPSESVTAAVPATESATAPPASRESKPAVPPVPPVTEPAAPAASIASSPPAGSDARPRPTEAVAAPAQRATPELPPRAKPREPASVAAVTRTTERTVATPTTRERATATWMVQEYGRAYAESRARAVADFYGEQTPNGAYWRRVAAEIAGRR